VICLSLANTPLLASKACSLAKEVGNSVFNLGGNEVKYTLRELEKVDGHAMYVEWYRDVETARSFS